LAPIDRVDYLSVDIGSGDFEALAAAREDLDRVRVLQVSTIQESADKIAELLQREGWLNVYRFAPGATSDTPYGAVTFNQGLQTWLHPAAAQCAKAVQLGISDGQRSSDGFRRRRRHQRI
jgi:hypothetical protein